jgi:hypothetical protein
MTFTIIVAIISVIISTLPLIGLIIVYVQAKRPYAFTGSGFRLISQFALINIWLFRVAGALLSLLALFLLLRSGLLIIIRIYFPLLLVVPQYLLLLATKDFCDMLAYAIDGDELANLPFPDRVQRWLKWLMIEFGVLFVVIIFLVYGFDTIDRFADIIDSLRLSMWFTLLQMVIYGFGWHYVKNYGDHLLRGKTH